MYAKEIPTFGASAGEPASINDDEVRRVIAGDSPTPLRYTPSPQAWEDQQLYFLLPDRFSDGNEGVGTPKFTLADRGNAVHTASEEDIWQKNGVKWQGGTLKGIKSKLGYLKRLGMTALWIGPVFKQVPWNEYSYHGYGVQDFLDIDPHFGTREDLRDLVEAAHKEHIFVILDIIVNHTGDVFGYEGGQTPPWNGSPFKPEGFRDSQGNATLPFHPLQESDLKTLKKSDSPRDCAIWPVELQAPGSFTCKGSISNWDNFPEYIEGDFQSLKDVFLGKGDIDSFEPSSALSTLCEVYKYWIAYADLDGYRIDTVKHMGDAPTRHLCTTLHEYAATLGKANFFLVGEVTGGRAYDTVQLTGLDAALGIGNVQQNLWNMCKGNAEPAWYFDLFRNAKFLKKGTDAWMRNRIVTMIDDHDQVWRGGNDKARFCSDDPGRKLALAAMGLNLTTLGIPCIYYGTEQQFNGHGGGDSCDRYIREAMFGGTFGAFSSKGRHCFDESNDVFKQVGAICKARQEHLALRMGRQYLREISGNGKDFGLPKYWGGRMTSIVAWSRILADREILCAMNTDTENTTQAWVTIDRAINSKKDMLDCIYSSSADAPQTVEVLNLNGKAVRLAIPPAGFVMYA